MVTCCQKCYEIDGEFYALKKTSITRSWYLYDVATATETLVTDAPTIATLNAGEIPANERPCNLLGGGGACEDLTLCYQVPVYVPAVNQGGINYAREDGGGNQNLAISAQFPITPDVSGTLFTTAASDDFAKTGGTYFNVTDSLNGSRRSEVSAFITIPPIGEKVSLSGTTSTFTLDATPVQFRIRSWNNRYLATLGGAPIGAEINNNLAWQYSDLYTPNAGVQELPLIIQAAVTSGNANTYYQMQVYINGAWRWMSDPWYSSTGGASIEYQTTTITLDIDGNKAYTLNGVTLDATADAAAIAAIESDIADGTALLVDCDLAAAYSTTITKTASDNFPNVGETVVYTVVATNTSLLPVMLKVSDVVQAPLAYVAASLSAIASDGTPLTLDSATPSSGTGLVVQTDTPLGAGETITMTYSAQKTADGPVVNRAVSETHYDDPSVNGVKSAVNYTSLNGNSPGAPTVEPSLSKVVTDPGDSTVGSQVTYRVYPSVDGGISTLIDTLPANSTFVSAIAYTPADVAYGGSYTAAESSGVVTVSFDPGSELPAGHYIEVIVERTDTNDMINEAKVQIGEVEVVTTAYVSVGAPGAPGSGAVCTTDLTEQTWDDPQGVIDVGASDLANGIVKPASLSLAWRAAYYNKTLVAPYTMKVTIDPAGGATQIGIKPAANARVYSGANASTIDGASVYDTNGNNFGLSDYANISWNSTATAAGATVTTTPVQLKLLVDKDGRIIWYYYDPTVSGWIRQTPAWDNAGMASGELFVASTGTGPPGTFAIELCEGGSEPLFA